MSITALSDSVSSSTKSFNVKVVWETPELTVGVKVMSYRLCFLRPFAYGSFVITQSWHDNKVQVVNVLDCLKLEDPK